MIAYDFDGVLVPDIGYVDIDQNSFDKMFLQLKPLFKPTGDWIIITGRTDVDLLSRWLELHFTSNPPSSVYVNELNLAPEQFKVSVLNRIDNRITYFESDPVQADYIARHTDHTVIHFSTYIVEPRA